MPKPFAHAAVIASALALALTPTAGSAAAPAGTPVYHHSDSGRTVHVVPGEKFKVRLKVCETCGYRWSFAHRPAKDVVKLVDKHRVSSAKPPEVGGINTITWTYKAVGHGKTRIKLIQRSPAQKVVKHFALTVKVH